MPQRREKPQGRLSHAAPLIGQQQLAGSQCDQGSWKDVGLSPSPQPTLLGSPGDVPLSERTLLRGSSQVQAADRQTKREGCRNVWIIEDYYRNTQRKRVLGAHKIYRKRGKQ